MSYSTGLSIADWYKLPLKLRERWWRETDYGKREPSAALRDAIAAAHGHRANDDCPATVTPEVRKVLACRSVANKIAVAIDCDIAPVGSLGIVAELVREGYLVWLDRTTLPHVGVQFASGERRPSINVDVYQLTARGVALCEQNGIKEC